MSSKKAYVTYKDGKPEINITISDNKSVCLELKNLDFSPYAPKNKFGLNASTLLTAHTEGYFKDKYNCIAGVATVGFGQTGKISGKVTIDEAFRNLQKDVESHAALLEKRYKNFSNLSGNIQSGLVDVSFNAGTFGTDLSDAIEKGDEASIKDILKEYTKYRDPKTKELKISKGLVHRRELNVEVMSGNGMEALAKAINYYDLLGQLQKAGLGTEKIAELFEGMAEVKPNQEVASTKSTPIIEPKAAPKETRADPNSEAKAKAAFLKIREKEHIPSKKPRDEEPHPEKSHPKRPPGPNAHLLKPFKLTLQEVSGDPNPGNFINNLPKDRSRTV